MKKALNLNVAFLMMLLTLTSCSKEWWGLEGSGHISTETRNISGFTGIDNKISGNVYVTQGSVFEVRVTTYDNYQHHIETRVSGNDLIIDTDHPLRDDEISIYITIPVINELSISGSADMKIMNRIASDNLKLNISGSGKIDMLGDCKNVDVSVGGSGTIILNGTAEYAKATISGSGIVKGFGLLTETQDANISGSGNIECTVSQILNAEITGSGKISYYGNATVNSHITGSGSIKHL